MTKRFDLREIDTSGAIDGNVPTFDEVNGCLTYATPSMGAEFAPGAVVLDVGQTVAQYQTANGVTVPAGTLIARKA